VDEAVLSIMASGSTNPQADNELCTVCASLNISGHKFNRYVGDLSLVTDRSFDDKGLEAMNIGFLDEFYQRRNRCPFCRLVYEATHRDDGRGVGHDGLDRDGRRVDCWLDWQLDGRYSTPQDPGHHHLSGALTRRLRLYSKTKDFQACYLVPLRPGRDIQTPSFQARFVQPESADIHQLRSWLDLCETHHEQCSTNDSQLDTSMKLRVIDVSLMRIVEISSTQRYCTLSYCWGRTLPFCLRKHNYGSLKQVGIREDDLPKTISHALQLISALGERYIWIDSLCIIQDDHEDWQKIAPLMDKIYGSSTLTICAASGQSCDSGLPGSKQSSRLLSQSVQNCAGLNLLAFKTLEDRIELSPWNLRAWAFQERMLSRRCLIFVDDRVFFQCRKVTWSEELDCESSSAFWTLDAIHSPLNLFNENPLRRYAKSVELYSGRLLTRQSDRLVAFEGIALSLAQNFNPSSLSAPFQYGLPAWYFDWALLWELKTPGQRIDRHESGGFFFPSWSWCGWHGTSEWRMSTTSTVLLNLHEWLMLRTWIIWYIGEDTEHQLVFRVKKPEETLTRGRWAGYALNELSSVTSIADDYDAYGRPLDTQVPLVTRQLSVR
jgi:hypothetical protein